MKSTKKEKKQYKKAFQEAMARELREHKSSFIVFSILRILVLVVLVRQIMLANYEGAFFCILTLLLLYVPSWIQVKLRIELPPPLEITIFCFIFAAEILGELGSFYVRVPHWDTSSTPPTASWRRLSVFPWRYCSTATSASFLASHLSFWPLLPFASL